MYWLRYLYKKYCTIFPVRSWTPLCHQLFQLSLCSNRNTFAQRGFQTFPKCEGFWSIVFGDMHIAKKIKGWYNKKN